jgi:DHA2 family multidrug resistance protein-like MFS transporter
MVAGLVLTAVGFGMLTQVGGSSSLAVLLAGSIVYSLGLSPVFTLTNDLIIGNAPPERAGSAAALSETSSELGGALGIAILGSLGTAIYRRQVADAVPAAIPPEAKEAALGTLGGALAVAERLPGGLGAELLGAARQAFTQAFELTAAISAAVVLGTAVLVWAKLRGPGGGSESAVQPALTADPTAASA